MAPRVGRAKTRMPSKHATKESVAAQPILERSDLRHILLDLAMQLAPADITQLMAYEDQLRARAAALGPHLAPLRAQLNLALDCLHDHLAGRCPQIPLTTVTLLAAAVSYFADELDVIPDFLPRIGRLDDAAVMALAFQLAHSGLQRYCDSTGRDDSILGGQGSH